MAGAFQSLKIGETRQIGTNAGRLERQGRALQRKGYYGQAGQFFGQAALDRSATPGFSSADRSISESKLQQQQDESLIGMRSRTTIGDGNPTVDTGNSLIQEARKSQAPVSFADNAATKSRESTLSGAFGEGAKRRAENLEARQGLFAEMKSAGAGVTAGDFRERAAKLGVDDKQWAAGIARIDAENQKGDAEYFGQNSPKNEVTNSRSVSADGSSRGDSLIQEARQTKPKGKYDGKSLDEVRKLLQESSDRTAALIKPKFEPTARDNTSLLDKVNSDIDSASEVDSDWLLKAEKTNPKMLGPKRYVPEPVSEKGLAPKIVAGGVGAEFTPAPSWHNKPKTNEERDKRIQSDKDRFNERYNKASSGLFVDDSSIGKSWKWIQAKYQQ